MRTAGRVAIVLFTATALLFSLGFALLNGLILHAMHTRGSFHGVVWPTQRLAFSIFAASAVAAICLLFLATRLRHWLKANPSEPYV